MTSSDAHKILACDMRPVNAPGEDEEWVYIVPEADLKQLAEQLQAALLQIEFLEERHEALGKTYDGLHGRLDEFSQSADFHRRENERLLEQLQARQQSAGIALAEKVALDAFAMWQMSGSASMSFRECVARALAREAPNPAKERHA